MFDKSQFPLVRGSHRNFTDEEARNAWKVVLGDQRPLPLIDGYENHELMPAPQGGWMLRDPVRWAEHLAACGERVPAARSIPRRKYARVRRIGVR